MRAKLFSRSVGALALILGLLNAGSSNSLADENCWFDGWVQLRISGDTQSGYISGWAGNRSLSWNVFSGIASGRMPSTRMSGPDNNDQWVRLYADVDFNGDVVLSGWIRSNYVRWRSLGRSWSTYESCIR